MGYWPAPPTPNCSKNFISALTITRVQRSQVIMHLVHGGNSVHGDVTFAPNHVLDQGYQDLVHLVGNSCYLSAARRRRGRFFSPIGSGPRGSGLWNGDRNKHWKQLLFISGSSSPGAVFFSYWIWAQGQQLVKWG